MTIRPSLKATLVAGAALGALVAATPAQAADLIEPVIIEAPIIEKVKPFGGWYIRGDVNYDFVKGDRFKRRGDLLGGSKFGGQPATPLPGGPFSDPVGGLDPHYDDMYSVGVGIGGHLGQYLRADITADYLFDGGFETKSDFGGCGTVVAPGAVAGCGSDTFAADMEAILVMANAYVDFGTYAGITPYVGAGIGFAHIDYSDIVQTGCVDPTVVAGGATGTACGTGFETATAGYDGDSSLRLAWSLAAGASYDINHTVSIDGGYRYTRVEDGTIGHVGQDATTVGYDLRDDGLDIHQIRLGARVKLH